MFIATTTKKATHLLGGYEGMLPQSFETKYYSAGIFKEITLCNEDKIYAKTFF